MDLINMFGKCTEDVKTKVSYATKEAIQKKAHEAGVSESEYIRTLLQIHIHGLESVQRLHLEKINRVVNAGNIDCQR